MTSQQVQADVTLISSAEAARVTQLTAITSGGSSFSTGNIASGQTSATLTIPANTNATIVASDTVNRTTIEKLNVTTSGDRIP